VSPRRGDRVTVPPPAGQWDVRFGTSEAAAGWEELCRHALANTRRCLEILRSDPAQAQATTDSTGYAATWRPTATTAATSSNGNMK
jgi:hypothetical protein